jgi:hypothetical protein
VVEIMEMSWRWPDISVPLTVTPGCRIARSQIDKRTHGSANGVTQIEAGKRPLGVPMSIVALWPATD